MISLSKSLFLNRGAGGELEIIKVFDRVFAFELDEFPLSLHGGLDFEPVLFENVWEQILEFSFFFLQLFNLILVQLGHSVDRSQTHFICFFELVDVFDSLGFEVLKLCDKVLGFWIFLVLLHGIADRHAGQRR